MQETPEALAAALVRDPFNLELRRRYAEALAALGSWADALEQYRLLVQQTPAAAAGHLGVAACLAELDDVPGARAAYAQGKACADFVDDPALARSLSAAAAAPALAVVSGAPTSPTSDVIPIATARDTRFVDIVGMEEVKQTIRLRIIEPFLKPGLFARYKKKTGGGVLLYGPPGCGKTMMARAIAAECQAAFVAVGIGDILNMWIGESEHNLAALFEKARSSRPAVLFFDELDALAYARSKAKSEHTRTLVNEFLSQLDGLGGDNAQLLVLAATNMPWDVDNAMKRPGRFDRQLFVPPPDAAARAEMFRTKLLGIPTEAIDHRALAAATEHCSGADIDGVIEQAKEFVLAGILEHGQERPLTTADLLAAAREAEPSTLEWLRTARNLVKYGGADRSYKDVERYLKQIKL